VVPDGCKVIIWRETAQATAHDTAHVDESEDWCWCFFGEMDRQKLMDALQLKHRVN
jgi:hypothetical protein